MTLDRTLPEIHRLQFAIRDLHDDLAGLRIVQISDLHIGNQVIEDYLLACAQRIVALRGDLLVVTGDIIDTNNFFLPIAGRFFQSMAPAFPYGILGIAGNHDYFHNGDAFFRILNGAGIRLLRNETVMLRRGHGALAISGMDSPISMQNRTMENEAIVQNYMRLIVAQTRSSDAPSLLLSHDPAYFPLLVSYGPGLVLSGHTHGGQIDVFSEDESRLASHPLGGEFYRGRYELNGVQLYVNRSMGSWLRTRIHVPAEITLIELVPG